MDRPKQTTWATNWIEYADWLEAKVEYGSELVDRLKYIYGGEQKRIAELEADRDKLRKALESMAMVLCNPDGECCIDCCDADKAVIDLAMTALEVGDE
jgi:hypothetical protein